MSNSIKKGKRKAADMRVDSYTIYTTYDYFPEYMMNCK